LLSLASLSTNLTGKNSLVEQITKMIRRGKRTNQQNEIITTSTFSLG